MKIILYQNTEKLILTLNNRMPESLFICMFIFSKWDCCNSTGVTQVIIWKIILICNFSMFKKNFHLIYFFILCADMKSIMNKNSITCIFLQVDIFNLINIFEKFDSSDGF